MLSSTACVPYVYDGNLYDVADLGSYSPGLINSPPLFNIVRHTTNFFPVENRSVEYYDVNNKGNDRPGVTVEFFYTQNNLTSTKITNYLADALSTSIRANILTITVIGVSAGERGDTYNIQLVNCSGSGSDRDPRNPISARSTLTRPLGPNKFDFVNFSGAGGGFINGCSGCACFNNCGNIRVPIITIQGQTTFDSEYLADILFTICDEFQYYKCKRLKSCCKINFIKPEQLLQTQFRTCGIELQKVVKGIKFNSLRGKLLAIYNQFSNILGPSFNQFYENFILYSMAKYILARVLYGDFNLDYLYKSFNKQFLYDLSNSRFCAFLELFEDCNSVVYGFNQFFKSGNKDYYESSYNYVRKVNTGCGCK